MIYFIEATGAGLLKIGFTDRDPEQRLKELQTGCPHALRLLATQPGNQEIERAWHQEYGHLRTTGEWFRIDDRLRGLLWWLEHGAREVGDLRESVASSRQHYHARIVALERRQEADWRRMVEARNQLDEALTDYIIELQRDVAELRSQLAAGSGVVSGRSMVGDCRM